MPQPALWGFLAGRKCLGIMSGTAACQNKLVATWELSLVLQILSLTSSLFLLPGLLQDAFLLFSAASWPPDEFLFRQAMTGYQACSVVLKAHLCDFCTSQSYLLPHSSMDLCLVQLTPDPIAELHKCLVWGKFLLTSW